MVGEGDAAVLTFTSCQLFKMTPTESYTYEEGTNTATSVDSVLFLTVTGAEAEDATDPDNVIAAVPAKVESYDMGKFRALATGSKSMTGFS